MIHQIYKYIKLKLTFVNHPPPFRYFLMYTQKCTYLANFFSKPLYMYRIDSTQEFTIQNFSL